MKITNVTAYLIEEEVKPFHWQVDRPGSGDGRSKNKVYNCVIKIETNEGSEGHVNEDCNFKVNGIFSCKLREGVAPWIQSQKKEFSLNILATHVVFKGASGGLIEIDLKEYSERIEKALRLYIKEIK